MKLKTLKDFRNYVLRNDANAEFFYNCLRQEAIKWIKEIMKGVPRDYCNEWMLYHINHLKSDIAPGKEVVVWWIEQFFNITEEDLR